MHVQTELKRTSCASEVGKKRTLAMTVSKMYEALVAGVK